jgi:hypothetical protein
MVCATSVTWFSGSSVFITPGRYFSDEPNCGREHALNLVYARQFRIVPGHHIRPGPGSSYIETASVKEFLLKRRML